MLITPIEHLKEVIQDLFQIMVQVNAYDLVGRSGKEVLESSVYVSLFILLQKVTKMARKELIFQRHSQP